MTTPSGQISLNDVNVELGRSGTTTIALGDSNVRSLAGVASGAISMNNLRGKSNRVSSSITISANTSNYVLNTSKVTGYVAGKTDVTLTINSGVVVYSGSTGSSAFQVDTSWTSGDTITIVNNGTILGKGGSGGFGAIYGYQAGSGGSGGTALNVLRATTINNANGRIAGGGGGGGGGNGRAFTPDNEIFYYYGGGGGGGGIGNGAGGSAMGDGGEAGTSGTLTSAGTGGGSGGGSATSGANGGSYGSSGGSSSSGGGSGGAAVVGNTNITWTAFGTRNGGIS